jgi:cathepsin O
LINYCINILKFVRRRSNKTKQNNKCKKRKRSVINYDDLKRKLKDLPQHWDWREKKAVTPVRNQGKCGACWAYSTVETIESMVAIKTKVLREYSIQQFIDCASEDNKGCDGGDTCAALVWMAENKVKLKTAKEYPLRDEAGECRVIDPMHGILIADNFTCDK